MALEPCARESCLRLGYLDEVSTECVHVCCKGEMTGWPRRTISQLPWALLWKMPDKSNLKKEELVLAHSLRVQGAAHHGREGVTEGPEAVGHVDSAVRR